MSDSASPKPLSVNPQVAVYKEILTAVLERRPSGTRQRLAGALSKNRSFISQITNPNYAVPIPASHLDILFEICHFSAIEKKQFLDAYALAHPNRANTPHDAARLKAHTIFLPDLGDDERNKDLLKLVTDFVRQLSRFSEAIPDKKSKRL
jgi:hypothetical protein